MSTAQQVLRLEELITKLPARNRPFANSLVGQWRAKRRLSQIQMVWVDRMIELATIPPPPPTPSEPTPQLVGLDMSKLKDLFGIARDNGIQVPRIRMMMQNGKKLMLKAATALGKNPGAIYIQMGDEYYGKVDSQGRLIIPSFMKPCEEVHELMTAVALDPSFVGRVQGQRLKWCIFCGAELRTTESLYYGYGPICAGKWGLEWGDPSARKWEDRVISEATVSIFDQATKAFKFGG